MANLEIAKIFYEIADILEIKNVEWKPRAYRSAAKSLESLSKDVKDIYKEGGIKALEEIPGIGEGLAKKIIQYIEEGKIQEYEKLKKKIPKGMENLMEVEGLGPKKISLLYKKLGITDIKDLATAIKRKKLQKLPGFGVKSEENILKGIQIFKKGKERMLLGIALPIAEKIVEELERLKDVHKIKIAGSLRRMKETIGDIDILVTSPNPSPIMDKFCSLDGISRVLAKGPTKSMVLLKNGLQVDIRIVEDKCFGAAMQYFTGSKEHSIELRKIAIKKGLKVSEYGVFKNNKWIAGKTEEEFYKALGMQYIEPELRENCGEIETALKKKLPKLIDYNEIKGDFHVHSKYSDGSDTIEEIAKKAKGLGYSYVCITDHSKTRAIAHGLDEKRLQKQIEEIEKLNKKLNDIRILKGAEVDILSDGSLDYPNETLKKLDIVIASVHTGFKMNIKGMTLRITKALENKYVDILGHPTGRLINRREPYEADIEKILDAAKTNNKLMEINAFPDRLDLNDVHVKMAAERKIKLAIGTDSHSTDHLQFIKLGVATARRGWAGSNDIVNTYSLSQLKKVLPKLR